MEDVLTFSASLFAGISATLIGLYVADATRQLEVEKTDASAQIPLFFKIFLPVAGNFAPFVRGKGFEITRRRTREMIVMAGLEEQMDEEKFLGVQIIMGIIGVLCMLLSFLVKPLLGVFVLVLFVIYPRVWLNSAVKKRHLEIQKALPNVLDLLTLSVEAGKDFLTSLRDILLRRRRDALSEELERTFREIQFGKQRRVALKELSQRVQQPDLSSVLNSIIQADELGVSIGHILRIQGDQLRTKRFSRAEKLANEAPVKILFPLALFILPAVILILLGPIILRSLKTLFG